MNRMSFIRSLVLLGLLFTIGNAQVGILPPKMISGVQLIGGRTSAEGNVLVSTLNDASSRPLCDDFFGMNEANAVCITMGYPRAIRFTKGDFFNTSQARWSVDGWKNMYSLNCSGMINMLNDVKSCNLIDNKEQQCTAAEVAGVVCQTGVLNSECSFTDFVCETSERSSLPSCIQESSVCNGVSDCEDGSDEKPELCNTEGVLRLESKLLLLNMPENSVAGTVYVKLEGLWNTVCGFDGNFNHREAQVMCRSLGYGNGMSVAFTRSYFGRGIGPVFRANRSCTGHESSLSQCPTFEFRESGVCSHISDAGIFCHAGKMAVQLVGGKTEGSGHLQITSSEASSPASICNTGFDDLDAQVVCRMLGYDGTQAVAHRDSPFGVSSGNIWNIVLDCFGHEKSIQDCRIKISNDTCSDRNTAAVQCVRPDSVNELLSRVLPANCGEPEDASTQFITSLAKIRGGQQSTRFDVPWLAQLNIRSEDGYDHTCGAIIISEYYIVTAAHCFRRRGRLSFLVRVGNFNNEYRDSSQQDYFIDKLWVHEHFDELTMTDNDIALIKVHDVANRGMRFGDRVKPVCLPKLGESYDDLDSCIMSGWGRTGFFNILPDTPRFFRTRSAENYECERIFGSETYTSSMSCFFSGNSDSSCSGDSGGPLACKGPRGRYVLYGISSKGRPCPDTFHQPYMFVRITKHLRWIQETIYKDLRLS